MLSWFWKHISWTHVSMRKYDYLGQQKRSVVIFLEWFIMIGHLTWASEKQSNSPYNQLILNSHILQITTVEWKLLEPPTPKQVVSIQNELTWYSMSIKVSQITSNDCLFISLFNPTTKNISMFCIIVFCERNPPVTAWFLAQEASHTESIFM